MSSKPKFSHTKQLAQKRRRIDAIDDEVIRLIAKRMQLSRDVAEIKKENNIPIEHVGREQEVIANAKAIAVEHGLNCAVAKSIMQTIIGDSRREQHLIIQKRSQ